MHQLGLSASQLSEACSVAVSRSEQETQQPGLRRDRIAKILMNCQLQPGSAAASRITYAELRLLAQALRVSIEWLSVQTENPEPIVWNVLAQPERSTHLLHLLGEYEERAGESTVWSEYLLCSFTSAEFMVAFHRAHFGEMDTAGVTKDRRQLVDFFNKTGQARRKRVLSPNRPYTLTSLIYDSELRRLAAGDGVYRSIPKIVRKASLMHTARVLEEPDLKMNLVIVDDKRELRAKVAWRDYEAVGVMGNLFALWNYHSGSLGWSENPRQVIHQRELVDEMKKCAAHRTNPETNQYLKHLAEII
jgi:hypothetical protein